MNKLKRFGREAAEDLSNFNGLEEIADFNGSDIVDFGGRASSFLNEKNAIKDRAYILKLKNLGKTTRDEDGKITGYAASDCEVVLFGGIGGQKRNENDPENIILGVNTEGDEVAVQITGGPVALSMAYALLVFNPTRVVMMKLNVNDTLQVDGSFVVTHFSPFKRSVETREIRIQDHVDEYSLKDKLVNINDGFTTDIATEVKMSLIAGADLSLTLYCGAQVNLGKGMDKAAQRTERAVKFRKGVPGKGFRG